MAHVTARPNHSFSRSPRSFQTSRTTEMPHLKRSGGPLGDLDPRGSAALWTWCLGGQPTSILLLISHLQDVRRHPGSCLCCRLRMSLQHHFCCGRACIYHCVVEYSTLQMPLRIGFAGVPNLYHLDSWWDECGLKVEAVTGPDVDCTVVQILNYYMIVAVGLTAAPWRAWSQPRGHLCDSEFD